MIRRAQYARLSSRRARAAGAVLLALVPGLGCGREFFRQWANQDASEAIFEKSRDPRWRLDMFSIEPPALSRFASPFDPDRPPAPPDDYASQALSPTPQWPDHRLIVPVEGTGYLDMLEAWKRERPDPDASRPLETAPNPAEAPGALPPSSGVSITPPPTPNPSPFAPGPNSGPNGGGMTPIPVPDATPGTPPDPRGPGAGDGPPQARASRKDLGVRLAAYQETNIPLPVPPEGAGPEAREAQPPRPSGADRMPTPSLPFDPSSGRDPDLSQPVRPRRDQEPGEYRAAEAATAEMAGILGAGAIEFDEAEAAGLPPNSKPYVLNPEQALKLALINSRAYQFSLENVFTASLAVTLQRFAFEPQFIAGLSPITATAAGTPANVGTNFLYRTREAPGGQASTLQLGTVAGFGKVFISGARLLGGFANTTVFNFTGNNPRQPNVQSFLPLTIVQPFLRGGGRAVTLEALTQAERTLLYNVRTFARFRQEFFVSILAANAGLTNPAGGTADPVVGYLSVVQQLQEVENVKQNVAAFARLLEVFAALVEGESSGLTQLQVDQLDQRLQMQRVQLLTEYNQYRTVLDQFKMQLGLPPDTPLTLDRGILSGFRETFMKIELWGAQANRELSDLPRFVNELPPLKDVVIDGRSVLENVGVDPAGIRNEDSVPPLVAQPDKLEELLLAAERVMLENRLDLMNARAQLYDAWRQIRFTENALKGVLNVQITNQVFTPTATTNPFAFLDQAKQFSLVLNAELPLVRLAERNAFRTALLNYERQRRLLMFNEDSLKFQVRNEVRQLQLQGQQYSINKRSFVLNLRQKDQAQEQLIAPPAAGGGGIGGQANASTQTNNLIQAQTSVLGSQNTLVANWVAYETQRLILYRDLGIMPYDEWEAYYEFFAPNIPGPGGAAAPGTGPGPGAGVGPAPAPPAANPAQAVGP